MGNFFSGINIGLKSLQVHKTALDVTGHNIANANNKGYSRQRAVQTATDPYTAPGITQPGGPGQIGTGVKIEEIERIKDQFLQNQIREESQSQGMWSKIAQGLNRIELTFNEPSESGLNSAMERFWGSLQDLSSQPRDPATRETVRRRASILVDSFHTLHDQLNDYQRALNRDVNSTVSKINSLSKRIADLNKQIVAVNSSGQQPNDLMDKRDVLFNELNQLVNVRGQVDQRGNLYISLGGTTLVHGKDYNFLTTVSQSDQRYQDNIIFEHTGEEAVINSGELMGIKHLRDVEIDNYLGKLDQMAAGLVERFNRVHQQGYDLNGNPGGKFFSIDTDKEHSASTIDLAKAIEADLNRIASGNFSDAPGVVTVENISGNPADMFNIEVTQNANSTYNLFIEKVDKEGNVLDSDSVNNVESGYVFTYDPGGAEVKFAVQGAGKAAVSLKGNPGSGANAVALADTIKKDKTVGDASITDYYESVISRLGVESQRAQQMETNQDLLVNQLENQETSISGVSLDEEMANMIKYQQAYNAAAKIITSTEKLLDNLMGIIR